MGKSFIEIVDERSSVRHYDTTVEINKEEISEILEVAVKSPSAWNLQQWRFIVFASHEAKERLLPIAFHQNQVVEAGAVVAILGDLEGNKNFDEVYGPLVKAGFMTEEIKKQLGSQIDKAYQSDTYPHDAALVNPSLAAMTLMFAAKAKGYDTCAMGGFDGEKFVKEFNVSSRYIPVMLISIGKAAQPAHVGKRIPVEKLTTWF